MSLITTLDSYSKKKKKKIGITYHNKLKSNIRITLNRKIKDSER